MEILGDRYARIVEENGMFFPNYKRTAQESAEKELGGDYNDEADNDPTTKKWGWSKSKDKTLWATHLVVNIRGWRRKSFRKR